jgi:hypothetical protein
MIDSAGRLGVGNTAPLDSLHVTGNIRASSNVYAMNRIGIATSNPAVALEINATDAILLPKGATGQRPGVPAQGHVRYNTDTNTFEGYGISWGSLGGVKSTDQMTYVSAEAYPTSNDGNIRFVNSNVETMRITKVGNVGIGLTNPAYKLDVAGDINFTGVFRQNGNAYIGSQWTTSGANVYLMGSNVGIGTTTPSYRLDVTGDIRVAGGIRTTDKINFSAYTNSFLTSSTNYDGAGELQTTPYSANMDSNTLKVNCCVSTWYSFGIHDGCFNRMLHVFDARNGNYTCTGKITAGDIIASGNVGIGTTAPAQKMHIGGVSGTDTYLRIDAGGTNANYSGIMLNELNTNYGHYIRYSAETDNLEFGYNNGTTLSTYMTTRFNGNVGIGTTTPNRNFEVSSTGMTYQRISGAVASQQALEFYDTTSRWIMYKPGSSTDLRWCSTSGDVLTMDVNGNLGINVTPPTTYNGYATRMMHIAGTNANNGSQYYGSALVLSRAGTLYSGMIGYKYEANVSGLQFYATDNSEVTTSVAKMVIRSDGRVGIGTTAPLTRLFVSGGAAGDWSTRISHGTEVYLAHQGGYGMHINTYNTDGNQYALELHNGTSVLMQVKNNGRVGVGTTSPAFKMHVAGDVYADGGWLRVSGNNGLYFESWGGGWFMQDGTYLRACNNKWIYTAGRVVLGSGCAVYGDNVRIDCYSDNLAFYGDAGMNGFIEDDAYRGSSYNFTGQHRCFPDKSLLPIDSNVGLIVSSDGICISMLKGTIQRGLNGITISESIPKVSLTTKAKDKAVFGVVCNAEDEQSRYDKFGSFVTPIRKEEGDHRVFVNSIGEGAIWVSNVNGIFSNGDYITSSGVPGYGMKQDEETLMNYTVGKITMQCDFNPKIIPKQRIKTKIVTINEQVFTERPKLKDRIEYDENLKRYVKHQDPTGEIIKEHVYDEFDLYDETGKIVGKHKALRLADITKVVNDLDENGYIQWEDDGNETELEYNIRHILPDGSAITKDEYIKLIDNGSIAYIAAFVSCTYHCG